MKNWNKSHDLSDAKEEARVVSSGHTQNPV